MRLVYLLAWAAVTTPQAAAQAPSPRQAPNTSVPPAPPPAQDASQAKTNVTLKLREKGSGIPVSKVEVQGAEGPWTSDGQGEVKIFVPPTGEGKLQLSRRGYEPLELSFSELRPSGEFEIFLFPQVSADEGVVVVTGKRRPQVSRKTVSIEESRKIAPGGDPAQVVKLLPGVQTSSRGGGGGDVVVRGSGPRDSRYYIDDLEVPFIFHGIGNLSVVPASLMHEVQFDAGGFGPEFGNATGGVIVIKTKNDIPARPKTEFVVNLPFYSGLYHERALSPDSMVAWSARRSYVDLFINKFLASQGDEAGGGITLVPYFGDAHAVYLKKNDQGHTKATIMGAYDGVRAAVPGGSYSNEEGRININFATYFVNLGVEHLRRLDKEWKFTTTPQVYHLDTNANFIGNELATRNQTLRAPTEFVKRLGKAQDLVVGFDPSYQWSATDLNAIDFRPGDPIFDPEDAPLRRVTRKERVMTFAAWASQDFQLGDTVLTPGLRSSYDSHIKKASTDPRLRLRHPFNEAHTLKGALGQYSQAPSAFQSSAVFGNPHLNFTKAMHYVLGLETKWSDAWVSDVQLFYKTAKGVVTGDAALRYDNAGSLRARGAELFIRRNLTSRLFGWLSYTYSKTETREADSDPFRDARYDQTHVLTLVSSYKWTALWEIGARYNYHTGDTYTPVTDAVYNANLDKYQDRTPSSLENSKRLPAYHALTLYGTRQFLFDTWKMALKFGMESYWPKTQVVGVSYNYDYSRAEPQQGLTAIPFIELTGEL